MKPISMQSGLRAIIYPITFVVKNIPTFYELFAYSSIQAVAEIVFDIDKSFGNNPVEKSSIRDVAKIPGEISLSYRGDKYGGTEFWHDEFSLGATLMKPVLKAGLITGYKFYADKDTESYSHHFGRLIGHHNDTNPFEIPAHVKSLLGSKHSKETLGAGARFANFIGEPFARIVDGVSKKYQNNIIKNVEKEVITQQTGGVYKILDGFKEYGVEVIPFAFTSAFMKVGALDYIGKLYGKTEIGGLTIKGWFVHVRENIMEDQFNLVHNNLEDLKGLSFYERKEVIFNKEDLSDSMKYTATAATFMVELAEKTLSNMLTMTSLSTPNKVIGNILYALDEYAPNILRPVGMAAGVYYVYDEFFDSKAKESSLSTFAKKSGMHLTQEDLCYISFVDDALSIVEPDQENASASSVIHDREVDMVLTLVGCLDQAGIEVSA